MCEYYGNMQDSNTFKSRISEKKSNLELLKWNSHKGLQQLGHEVIMIRVE